jgi:hypothetical protein
VRTLREESMEFSAGRVEGLLPLLRAVVKQRSSVLVDAIYEQSLGIDSSQRRGLVQIPNDLSAEPPQIVHVPANRLARKTG